MSENSKQAPNAPDEPRLLRNVVYEKLRDAITYGDLLPGTPLSDSQLSRELKISRTPVREALQQLEREGLVQIIPGRAVTVAAPSMQEVMNVVHMRYLLEPEIARLAAQSAQDEAIEVLRQAVEQMEVAAQKGDRLGWSRLDTLFHETLSEATSNNLLGKMALQMRNRVHYMINDPQTNLDRVIDCTREHREIVEAIASRDVEKAESLMRSHLNALRKSLFERFAHI